MQHRMDGEPVGDTYGIKVTASTDVAALRAAE
jgi:hypothetical protein